VVCKSETALSHLNVDSNRSRTPMDDDEEPDRNVLVFDYKGDIVAGLCSLSVFVMKKLPSRVVSYPLCSRVLPARTCHGCYLL
jgi:hypothetical protein